MVSSDVIFAATGVTQGSLVAGLKPRGDSIETQTLLLRSSTGERRIMTCRHPM